MMWRSLLAAGLVFIASAPPAVAQTDATDPPARQTERAGPFRKLFTTLGRDLAKLPSRENAPVLFNGALLAVAAAPFDELATLGASSSPHLKKTFGGLGKAIGREWIQGGGALAAYVAGSVWDKPRVVHAAGDLIEAQIVAATVTQGLKFAFNRTRPDGEARSFPSGHASASFATATVLHRHFGRKIAIPAYAIAVYTSASRLQANSHYPSDVFFGAALGIAIAQTATLEIGETRLHVTPAVTADGAMVTFSVR